MPCSARHFEGLYLNSRSSPNFVSGCLFVTAAKENEPAGSPEDYTSEPVCDSTGGKRLLVSMADTEEDVAEKWLVSRSVQE